jgi:hypothetical protein
MDAVYLPETLVSTYQNFQDQHRLPRRRENLISHIGIMFGMWGTTKQDFHFAADDLIVFSENYDCLKRGSTA